MSTAVGSKKGDGEREAKKEGVGSTAESQVPSRKNIAKPTFLRTLSASRVDTLRANTVWHVKVRLDILEALWKANELCYRHGRGAKRREKSYSTTY